MVYHWISLDSFLCYIAGSWCFVVVQSLSNVRLLDCSMPGFPVLHCLPEFAQIHVLWVSDALQPSHPLWPSSFCLHSFPASGSFPFLLFIHHIYNSLHLLIPNSQNFPSTLPPLWQSQICSKNSFRFTGKLRRNYRDCPLYLLRPLMHSLSHYCHLLPELYIDYND